MKKKLLITGGTGYLGKSLAIKLKDKYKIFLTGRNNKQNFETHQITKCPVIPMNLSDINQVNDVINQVKPEIIIHAGATKFIDVSEDYPLDTIDNNILGTSNISRVAIDKKVRAVIGISTDKAAPPISNTYGLSKSLMERTFCSLDGNSVTKFVCVRYGNVIWSTGSVLTEWKRMMINNNNIITSTGSKMRRFFFTVEQACDLVITTINKIDKFHGKIITINMKSCSIDQLREVWKKKFKSEFILQNSRQGERSDEYLVGETELSHTHIYKYKGKIYYVIDFKKTDNKELKNKVSSKNAVSFTKKELKDLIEYGIDFD